jgi:ribosome-associated translation inhibitor RaiA
MMKVVVRQSGIALRKWTNSSVKRQILALSPLRQIDEAQVRIAKEDGVSPPFHVRVHLVTPGPDIAAEARDHTLAAALGKVVKRVTEEIRRRSSQQSARRRAESSRYVAMRTA